MLTHTGLLALTRTSVHPFEVFIPSSYRGSNNLDGLVHSKPLWLTTITARPVVGGRHCNDGGIARVSHTRLGYNPHGRYAGDTSVPTGKPRIC